TCGARYRTWQNCWPPPASLAGNFCRCTCTCWKTRWPAWAIAAAGTCSTGPTCSGWKSLPGWRTATAGCIVSARRLPGNNTCRASMLQQLQWSYNMDRTDAETPVAELRENMRRFVEERNWQSFHAPKNICMALAVEVAE